MPIHCGCGSFDGYFDGLLGDIRFGFWIRLNRPIYTQESGSQPSLVFYARETTFVEAVPDYTIPLA